MGNKYMTLVALAVVAVATGCSDDNAVTEQQQNPDGTHTVTLAASVKEGQTRVGLKKDGSNSASFYWHKGDQILVQTVSESNNSETYGGKSFSITSLNSDATAADFSGKVDEGYEVGKYAVCPYNEGQTFDASSGTKLTFSLPSQYNNYAVGSAIFSSSTATNMPLLGTITDGEDNTKNITFKCLGGLAVIRIENMQMESGTLIVTAGENLAGNFSVTCADEATITNTDATITNGSKTVTFNFSGATKNDVGVFYLPLAVGDYTNVTVQMGQETFDYGNVSISRAGVTALSLAIYDGDLTAYQGKLVRNYGNNKYYLGDNKYSINNHEFVDLGLSVLWATMNLGATVEADYGNYYAWGETETKTNYSWEKYNYGSSATALSKYYSGDSNRTLDATDDAAVANWKSGVRMPTSGEMEELVNKDNCTLTWTSQKNSNGVAVNGYEVKGTNKMTIFLPAAGYYNGSNHTGGTSIIAYWSSTLYVDTQNNGYGKAHFLYYNSSQGATCQSSYYDRCYGFSVRPVAKKPQ